MNNLDTGNEARQQISSIAALRNFRPEERNHRVNLVGYYEQSVAGVGGGIFYYDDNDKLSADNGGTIIVSLGQYRWKRAANGLGFYFEDFGADPTDTEDSTDAIQRAVDVAGASEYNVIRGTTRSRFRYSDTIRVSRSVRILGSGIGLKQGAGTEMGLPSRYDSPDDTAFIWRGPADTLMWLVGNACTFKGCIFACPEQNFSAKDPSQIVRYGTVIKTVGATEEHYGRNLNVLDCIYYGCFDFIDAGSECLYAMNNYGYAAGTDYRITNSADVNRIVNCHVNPNVARGDLSYARIAALDSDNSFFVDLDRHDETLVSGCHAMAKGTLLRTRGESRLNGINVVGCIFDQSGALLDCDANSSSHAAFTSCTYYHAYAWNDKICDEQTGLVKQRVIRPDAGIIVLRKTTTSTNINMFYIKFASTSINISNLPLSSERAPYVFNFQCDAGYVIDISGLHIPTLGSPPQGVLSFNNDPNYNMFTPNSHLMLGVRNFALNCAGNNYLPNPTLSEVDAGGRVSRWLTMNAELSSTGHLIPLGSVSYALCRIHRPMGSRTFFVVAQNIGSSKGIEFTSYDAQYENSQSGTGTWSRIGRFYYARGVLPGNKVIHDLRILAGEEGDTQGVTIKYAGLTDGDSPYLNDRLHSVEAGNMQDSYRWNVTLQAGKSYSLPSDAIPKAGVLRLTFYCVNQIAGEACLLRLSSTSPNARITMLEQDVMKGEEITLDWPSNAPPTITSLLGGDFTLGVQK